MRPTYNVIPRTRQFIHIDARIRPRKSKQLWFHRPCDPFCPEPPTPPKVGLVTVVVNDDGMGGKVTVECDYDNNTDTVEIIDCKPVG